MQDRYWQNWDESDTSSAIDRYWRTDEGEKLWRTRLAEDLTSGGLPGPQQWLKRYCGLTKAHNRRIIGA